MALLFLEFVLFLVKQPQTVAPRGIQLGSLEQQLQVLTTTLRALMSADDKKFVYYITKIVIYS